MNKRKFFLEELVEEIRGLSDQYETDEHDTDIFLLKPNESTAFADDIVKIVKDYFASKQGADVEEEDLDADDFDDDLFWLDDDIE